MNNQKKDVYFLILSLRAGGAERQISELYKELPIKKIICVEQGNMYNVPSEYIITLSKHNQNVSSILKYLYIPVYLYRLYKAIKPNKNTIIISFLERANLLNAICKFFFKIFCIQSIRTNYTHYCIQKRIPTLLKKTIIKSYKRADLVVGNSTGNMDDLIENFGINKNKTVVINNFYDAEKILQLSKESLDNEFEKLFAEHFTVTFVARFDDKKGHLHLVRVLHAIKNEGKGFKLFFIGEGELKSKIVELCILLNLSVYDIQNDTNINFNSDVYFMGFQKNPYKFIAKSKIFAFPSIFEGLPNALIEAIICNTFCIAADCPSGPREIMSDNMGIKKIATEPELTKYGYLMPPFSGKLFFDNFPLTAEEIYWKEVLLLFANEKNKPVVNNLKIVNKYSKEVIINKWKEIL